MTITTTLHNSAAHAPKTASPDASAAQLNSAATISSAVSTRRNTYTISTGYLDHLQRSGSTQHDDFKVSDALQFKQEIRPDDDDGELSTGAPAAPLDAGAPPTRTYSTGEAYLTHLQRSVAAAHAHQQKAQVLTPKDADTNTPPVIDLRQDKAAVVAQVAAACERWGFFQVRNHGVRRRAAAAFDGAMRAFFALPREEKAKYARSADNARGYVGYGDEQTNRAWDAKECLDFGNKNNFDLPDDHPTNAGLNGFNRIPGEAALPGFRASLEGYYKEVESVAERVGGLMALGLGAREDHFKVVMDGDSGGDGDGDGDSKSSGSSSKSRRGTSKHTSHLRMNYYPASTTATGESASTTAPFGVGPHSDSGFLTILAQDPDVHTLEVQDRVSKAWVPVTPVPGALTVNTGDLSVIFSNGRYHAPIHRVRRTDRARYSAPYFYNPSYQSRIAPIPGAAGEGVADRFWPLEWGYFRSMRVLGNFGDFGGYVRASDWAKEDEGAAVAAEATAGAVQAAGAAGGAGAAGKGVARVPIHVRRAARFTAEVDYDAPFDCAEYQAKLRALEGVDALAAPADDRRA